MTFHSNEEMYNISKSLERIANALEKLVDDGIPGPGPCPSYVDWFGSAENMRQYCKLGKGHPSHQHESVDGTVWSKNDGKRLV